MPIRLRLLAVVAVLGVVTACCPAPLDGSAGVADAAPATGVVGTVLAHDGDVTWLRLDGGERLAVRPAVDFESGTSLYVVGSLDPDGTLRVVSARPLVAAGGGEASND